MSSVEVPLIDYEHLIHKQENNIHNPRTTEIESVSSKPLASYKTVNKILKKPFEKLEKKRREEKSNPKTHLPFVRFLRGHPPVRLQLNPAAAGWFRLDRRQTGRKKRTARQHTAIGLATPRALSLGPAGRRG